MKYINFKRYKFSTIVKNLNTITYNFLKIFKYLNIKRLNFRKFYKYLDIRRFNFYRIKFNFYQIRKINYIKNKYFLIHLPLSIIFFGILYLAIPTLYKYDKSDFERLICKSKNIECVIRGDVHYRFYPTPRIKIKNLIINEVLDKENTLIKIENSIIKLSIKNLLAKEKHKFKKINFNNFEINFNLKNFKKYKNIFSKEINFVPIIFTNGQITFSDKSDYVGTIYDANLDLRLEGYSKEAKLTGNFLNDNIFISFNSKKTDDKPSTDVILKMSDLNLLTKVNLFNSEKDKNTISGNILIKKDKNRFTGIFDYKDNEIIINKSNIKNIFSDGKLEGRVKFLPYFDFDLDLSLHNMNFTKLYNYFLSLDEKNQKNLFQINRKINGKLSLSSNKIYSSYNLVKSFESRIKFNNGNILVEQFLINLGKLGAADILGVISSDKKFTDFKYDSNIFVDNRKKFLSKFGIYNKQEIFSNLFVSGRFDLNNIKNSFYEISSDKELSKEDVNFIEREFNDYMLADGYKNLFRFPKFKEFVKSISSETN